MKTILLLALVALSCALPNYHNPNARIINGQPDRQDQILPRMINGHDVAYPRQVPFQVSIQYLGHICSGVLITKQWVLTAASCVVGLSEQLASIQYDSDYHNKDGLNTKIESITIHPGYNRTTIANDLALIKTRDVMNVTPALLANANDMIFNGVELTISGWGIETIQNGELSPNLKIATVRYIDEVDCVPLYRKLNIELPPNVFCGGNPVEGGASICKGDIGGPVNFPKQNNKLFGIASFTRNCGGVGQPSVFTDVTKYHDWITNVTACACF